MTPEHLPLAERKGLAVKLLAYAALLGVSDSGGRSADDDAALSALALDRAVTQARASPDACRLDHHVQQRSVRFLRTQLSLLGEALSRQQRERAEELLDGYCDLTATLSCADCATSRGGRVCSGGPGDHEAVRLGGGCLLDTAELFRQADAVVRWCYRHFIPPGGAADASPLFSTERVTDPPVGAHTRYERNGFHAMVTLRLGPERLSVDDYLGVLYHLTHELAAHAYSGVAGWPRARHHTAADNPFAEGWMDHVAVQILARWLTVETDAEFELPDHPADRLDAATEHSARRGRLEPAGPVPGDLGDDPQARARAVRNGHRAAKRMLGALISAGGALEDFLGLSCAWNSLCHLPDVRRDSEPHRVVAACNDPANRGQLRDIAMDFLAHKRPPEHVWARLAALI